jgi:subtilisin family serine protease
MAAREHIPRGFLVDGRALDIPPAPPRDQTRCENGNDSAGPRRDVYIRPPMSSIPPRRPSPAFQVLFLAILVVAPGCVPARPSGAEGRSDPVPIRRLAVPPGGKLDPELARRLERTGPSVHLVVLVDLTEQADLAAIGRRLAAESATKSSRRAGVVTALERVAGRQQSRLQPELDRLLAVGTVSYARPVAILNRLVVEGTPEGIRALAASPEVARVLPDWTSERPRGAATEPSVGDARPLGETFRSWAVDATGASRLWDMGLNGTGVSVGSIDTGAFEAHEQLQGRLLPGERGWFDPVEGTSVPTDGHGHGTGVLSQAVGSNADGRVVGIAPGARWCAALANWRNFYSRSRMTLAADWMLRVARPDVLVNAWSHDEGDCAEFDRPFINAWKASGIFVVFPAGNRGPAPGTGEAPAQLAGILPDGGPVFSVAALGPAGLPLASSSRGPSRCGSPAFPSLAGPGGDLPMAAPGNPRAYVRAEGTSLTAGVVAGCAALLLQAEPETEPEELERVLVQSARDVLPPGRDDATGAGAIDLPTALTMLRARRPR